MAGLFKAILLLPFKALRLASRAVRNSRGSHLTVDLPIAGLDADGRAQILFSLREAARSAEVGGGGGGCAQLDLFGGCHATEGRPDTKPAGSFRILG